MATIQDFSGWNTYFETGSTVLDADSRPGTFATASCTTVGMGFPGTGVKIAQHPTTAWHRSGGFHTFTPNTQAMMVAYVQLEEQFWGPSAANPITELLAVHNASENPFWYIRVDENERFELYDSANTLLAHAPITPVSTPSFEYLYRHYIIYSPGSVGGDGQQNGAWAWYIGELGEFPTLVDSGTGADFTPVGGGTVHGMYRSGQSGPLLQFFSFPVHGTAYLMDDVAGIEDRIGGIGGYPGDFRVVHEADSKIIKDSKTPDCDENGNTVSLDDLTGAEKWKKAGDLDTATFAEYLAPVSTTLGGAVKVAAPRSLRTGHIEAARWLFGYSTLFGLATRQEVHGYYDAEKDAFTVSKSTVPNSGSLRYDRRIEQWPYVVGGENTAPYRYQAVMGMTVTGTALAAGRMKLHQVHFGTLQLIPDADNFQTRLDIPSIGHFADVRRNQPERPL